MISFTGSPVRPFTGFSYSFQGTSVTPPGNGPVSVIVGTGNPVVVTLNVPATPAVKVVVSPLVTTGAS